ncbi:sensor histidine kinase [Rhodonellum sp.]|uniref:sensor histidine kinase n=1 Tax=Rhodonellum sp. TaxID=2231180 RepID=UPI002718D0B8|nr:histidine kinase [Rhodonellum sp.]MDO9554375.1 histidine kinase [Rhodonellum sp.]
MNLKNKKYTTTSAPVFRSFGKFILLNFVIALVLTLFQCAKCFLSSEGLVSILPDFGFSFLMSSALSMGGFQVQEFFDKRIPWIKKPVKRLLLTAGSYLIYSFIVSYVLVILYVLVSVDGITLGKISWWDIIGYTKMPVAIALVIISIFTTRSWLYQWRNSALETEKLKSENLASQYQSLKNQLNPHFLFNSLNALSHLVYESPDKSAAFIQQLSRIYRYVLDVQQEELVAVERELAFAQNFLSLQKIRFDESLEFRLVVDRLEEYFIPPLSLQLLLENAVKHNVASMENPLKITIERIDDKLIVRNNLQEKLTPEVEERGIGLENIFKRYALLSDQIPKITKSKAEFIVELPLLRLDE